MEAMGEQHPFAQHSLVPSRELDFGDCEGVSQMQAAIHVGEGKVSKPFWKLGLDFIGG
jgi:hypothetical protein